MGTFCIYISSYYLTVQRDRAVFDEQLLEHMLPFSKYVCMYVHYHTPWYLVEWISGEWIIAKILKQILQKHFKSTWNSCSGPKIPRTRRDPVCMPACLIGIPLILIVFHQLNDFKIINSNYKQNMYIFRALKEELNCESATEYIVTFLLVLLNAPRPPHSSLLPLGLITTRQ